MASWVFCNCCFRPPHRTSCFSLTNCGHVYCDVCLGKGRKGECLICKVPCHTLLLSEHMDADIRALFLGIDGLCRKYSRETSQVSEFQEKHRKRLLAFYREKISKLEECLRRSGLQTEQLRSTRLSQQTTFSTMKTPVLTPSAKPGGRTPLPHRSATSDRVEAMQVDPAPSPARKPEVSAGPARISLISPPQDGHMGWRPEAPSVQKPGICPPSPAALPLCARRGGLRRNTSPHRLLSLAHVSGTATLPSVFWTDQLVLGRRGCHMHVLPQASGRDRSSLL
ncbi:probable E3 SUMO-protein ligase RNF212 isoform X2 [Suricata suricatta]|uniref:probable E3 SUMO-protein ligase RNF212 isoform X2 n=1 Tax=Suricata suricatta TaxID=37032 RepID=UPI0011554EC6|nr:probable E3 SUMO-protein ligase RNF212 isoform X2 [Suricata suricatta]